MDCCWTDGKLCELVQLYSKFNNLWDRGDPCYDNLRSRHTSYKKILASLSMPGYISVSDVVAKLRELRSTYVTELNKINTGSETGCIYRPSQPWFEAMNEFLYDHLDADEKLAEYPSSGEDKISSKEDFRDECYPDINSTSESDSESLIDPVKKNLQLGKARRSFRPSRKSQAFFLRSPTVLRSTKMNTRYELPRRSQASSPIPLTGSPIPKETFAKRPEDVRQSSRLVVNIYPSEVSIKYIKTEIVDGDEKCYRKNLRGPRCSTSGSPHFKNIKMVISKSGYSPGGSRTAPNEKDDEETELRDMISILNLQGVSTSLTKFQENGCSPSSSCSSITSMDSVSHVKSSSKNCCEDAVAEESEVREGETILEMCSNKTPKVVCLGDGSMFDENLMDLIQDLSIKICPVEVGCGSGNCSAGQTGDNIPCRTCSMATRPVKEYRLGGTKSKTKVPKESFEEPTTGEKNIYEGKRNSDESGTAYRSKEEGDNSMGKLTEESGFSSEDKAQGNYDLKVVLKSADKRSLSGRDSILQKARKELWEAGKLYNNGKYVDMRGSLDSDLEKGEPSEFDSFGTEVASSLKMMSKQRATKLKRDIAEALQLDDRRRKFF